MLCRIVLLALVFMKSSMSAMVLYSVAWMTASTWVGNVMEGVASSSCCCEAVYSVGSLGSVRMM